MTRDDETKAEAAIRSTIRLSCEGLGLASIEADDIASRAIATLRARKGGAQRAGGVMHAAVGPPAPSTLEIKRKARLKARSAPSGVRNDSKLIDHLIARWQNR